ncbi:RNA polymerase sigma factor [Marinobacteraceae bacterium S3BR75-40.1]
MAVIPFGRRRKARRFEQLVQPHLGEMYRFAYRLTGDRHDAEDLVQDVLTKLFPKTDEMLGVEQLRPWLSRVLYRHFIDACRRHSRQPDRPMSLVIDNDNPLLGFDLLGEDDGPGPLQLVDRDRLNALVEDCLASLPPDQKALLVMHDVEGWRQEDVAAVLDIPVGTVKSRLHRCRSNLRQRLSKKMEPFAASGRVEGE